MVGRGDGSAVRVGEDVGTGEGSGESVGAAEIDGPGVLVGEGVGKGKEGDAVTVGLDVGDFVVVGAGEGSGDSVGSSWAETTHNIRVNMSAFN